MKYSNKIAISACLCGVPCRYDGNAKTVPALKRLFDQGKAVLLCPEVDGGLPTPRPPCERVNGRILSIDGADRTAEFRKGAEFAWNACQTHGVRIAVLKESSPSCGSNQVYDGSFSGRKIPGEGVTAALLRKGGICVYSDENFPAELEEI